LFEGLKNFANLGSVLKQAQEMGSKIQGLKEDLKHLHAQGTAGAGLVTIEVNGLCEVLACRIDPSLLKPEDREVLEDLIAAATNQAMTKAKDLHAEAIRGLTGGMDFPGMGEMMNKLTGGAD
jgi:DNA-binding YbaB/EbfC family protein